MDPTQNNNALFQQIGSIQGTLTALNANISDFKTEFRTMTNAQNDKIESTRKEMGSHVDELAKKIEGLEQFKNNYDGAQSEARKTAQLLGGLVGGIVSLILSGIVALINYYVKGH